MISNYLCAVIDIGSNTVRMVIFAGSVYAPITVMNISTPCRLGDVDVKEGERYLKKDNINLAVETLTNFKLILSNIKDIDLIVFATEAVRSAKNKNIFLDKIKKIGFEIEILKGEEEARYAALGVKSQLKYDDTNYNHLVCDLGGGSLEIANINKISDACSMPFGILSIKDEKNDIEKLAQIISKIKNEEKMFTGEIAYLSPCGGSFRSLGRLINFFAKEKMNNNGFQIETEKAISLLHKINNLSLHQIQNLGLVNDKRLPHINKSILILLNIISEFNPNKLFFINAGIREGAIYNKYVLDEKYDPIVHCAIEYSKPHILIKSQRDIVNDHVNNFLSFNDLSVEENEFSTSRIIDISIPLIHIAAVIEPKKRAEYVSSFIENCKLPALSNIMRLALKIILQLRYGYKDEEKIAMLLTFTNEKFVKFVCFLGFYFKLLFKSTMIGWQNDLHKIIIFNENKIVFNLSTENLWEEKKNFNYDLLEIEKLLSTKTEINFS